MKTFTTLLNTEKNKRTGASPVWILKIPFVTGTVYLSDRTFTYTGLTIKPWVESWGAIDEDIVDEMGSPQVSDFSVNIIIDPDEDTDIHDLLWSENVETLDCELYLWFEGLTVGTDPMVLMWSGNIVDFEKVNELLYSVRLVDESVRIDKYPGRVLSLADYASASLDDVGYQMPILYGAVTKVPALRLDVGVKTSLMAALTAVATDFYITDGTGLANGDNILIEAEQITITTISSNHITACTRGANSTTAVAHTKGALVLEKKTSCVFLFADHPVKSIGNIYALRPDGVPVDVTSLCTKYTGQGGANDLAGYEGKAVITCPGYITFEQAVDLGLTDTIAVTENIGVDATLNSQTIEERFCTDGPITVTTASGSCTMKYAAMPSSQTFVEQWMEFYWVANNILPTTDGSTCRIFVTLDGSVGPWDGATVSILNINGAGLVQLAANPAIFTTPATWWPSTNYGFTIDKGVYGHGESFSVSITHAKQCRRVTPSILSTMSGTVTKSGTVALSTTSNQYADVAVGDNILISGDGYQDDGSGTYTGTPSALIEQPDHVFKHFLYTYASWPVADFTTDADTSFAADGYKFHVVINQRKRMKEWLSYMALQCRCWFRFASGKAHLLYRPDTLVSDKTITAAMICMNADYTTTTKVSRSSITEIINKVDVYYSRDWSKAAGREAYQAVTSTSSTASIVAYGEKEQPDLFLFDFIGDSTMAADLKAFYLARYKDRKKVVSMDLFLDNAELEFADAITVTPLSSLVGEVRKVNFAPGSGRDMRNDMITITMREY